MNYRKACGENINHESWLMRNLWNVSTPRAKGFVTIPKQLKSDGIKRLMERALWAQGIRKDLLQNKRRHEFQANHSYRKWFKTRCELAGLRSIVVEILLSHSTGISDSYFRPTERELLEEYLKAADFLTIEEENRLRKKLDDLSEKSKEAKYIIEGKLTEKDNEIREIRQQINVILAAYSNLDQTDKNRVARELYEKGIYRRE